MLSFLRKASLRIINQSCVPVFIKRIQQGDPDGSGQGTSHSQLMANHAQSIMTNISKHCPSILRPHIAELFRAIRTEKHPRLIELSLQAIAAASKYDPSLAPSDKYERSTILTCELMIFRRVLDDLCQYIDSDNRRHAKFATQILTYCKKKDEYCNRLVEVVTLDTF